MLPVVLQHMYMYVQSPDAKHVKKPSIVSRICTIMYIDMLYVRVFMHMYMYVYIQCICYAQSSDSDHPRISLHEPRIQALGKNPRIAQAKLG